MDVVRAGNRVASSARLALRSSATSSPDADATLRSESLGVPESCTSTAGTLPSLPHCRLLRVTCFDSADSVRPNIRLRRVWKSGCATYVKKPAPTATRATPTRQPRKEQPGARAHTAVACTTNTHHAPICDSGSGSAFSRSHSGDSGMPRSRSLSPCLQQRHNAHPSVRAQAKRRRDRWTSATSGTHLKNSSLMTLDQLACTSKSLAAWPATPKRRTHGQHHDRVSGT